MPKLEAGWELLPIEKLLSSLRDSVEVIRRAIGSSCLIVLNPFVTTVYVEEIKARIGVAVGVGSIVCERETLGTGWTLVSPAWTRVVKLKGKCRAYVSQEVEKELASLGLKLERYASLEEAFEDVCRGGRGFVVLSDLEELEVEHEKGLCGRLSTHNPLHPASVVGKTGLHACVDATSKIAGPRARLLHLILSLDGKELIWIYEGMGELVLLGFNPFRSSEAALLAGLMAIAYSCGEPLD